MYMQFFGNYLLNQGLVSAAALMDALDKQAEVTVSFEALAVNDALVDAAQAEAARAEAEKSGKFIGDVMVEKGFLTQEQVGALLHAPPPGHLLLGQALVEGGHMSAEQFEAALSSYKNQNSIPDADFHNVKDGVIKLLIGKFCEIIESSEASKYITSYLTLLFKNLIRFVGDDFAPLEIKYLRGMVCTRCVAQKINGKFSAVSVIDAEGDALVGFASRFSKETIKAPDEYALACLSEFLNLHNGLYAVNFSNEEGDELELEPQTAYEEYDLEYMENIYIVPVCFTFGTINFIISF
ncbi:MAG: chemotaxis protein CheX [Oscillospiraceae bacterium]|nr:chemotaxis protein CheX [Oscillospiraceae bacterium]